MSHEIQIWSDTEAAAFLRISRQRLVRLARRKVVPAVILPDKSVRFDRRELLAFVEKCKQGGDVMLSEKEFRRDPRVIAILMREAKRGCDLNPDGPGQCSSCDARAILNDLGIDPLGNQEVTAEASAEQSA